MLCCCSFFRLIESPLLVAVHRYSITGFVKAKFRLRKDCAGLGIKVMTIHL